MKHSSHKTRISDSSLFDEICIYCGATDGMTDNRLKFKCPSEGVIDYHITPWLKKENK